MARQAVKRLTNLDVLAKTFASVVRPLLSGSGRPAGHTGRELKCVFRCCWSLATTETAFLSCWWGSEEGSTVETSESSLIGHTGMMWDTGVMGGGQV